jgi:hypothetical protein
MIASSCHGFIKALGEIERLLEGRNDPVRLESNPVSAVERERTFSRIAESIDNAPLVFWENWFAG